MTNQKRVVSLGTPREVNYLLDRKRWADIGLLVSHPISDEALIYSRNPKDVQDDKYNYIWYIDSESGQDMWFWWVTSSKWEGVQAPLIFHSKCNIS